MTTYQIVVLIVGIILVLVILGVVLSTFIYNYRKLKRLEKEVIEKINFRISCELHKSESEEEKDEE